MKTLSDLSDILNVIQTAEMGDDINMQYKALLLSALSEEFGAWYFYIISKPYIIGEHFKDIKKLFEETAKDELEDHAYWLMERLNQLGYSIEELAHPSSWANFAEHKYIKPIFDVNGNIDPKTVLEQAIQSEIDAIATYTNLYEFTNAIKDSTSNLKIRQILADEEEHLSELRDIYDSIK